MRLVVTGRPRSGTTITCTALNTHPDIWITNELLLYDFFFGCSKFSSFRKWTKKRFTENYRQRRFALPFDTNRVSFVKHYKQRLNGRKSLTDKITAAEECIFREKYKIFGDKGDCQAVKGLNNAGLPFKALYIYRDGRDSVASSMLRHKDKKDDKTWKTSDPHKSSLYWANSIQAWFNVREQLNKTDYMEIHFEHFVENTDQVYKKIAAFLEVDDMFDRSVINQDKANIGRYTKTIPDWESSFSQEAIEILKQLNYIK